MEVAGGIAGSWIVGGTSAISRSTHLYIAPSVTCSSGACPAGKWSTHVYSLTGSPPIDAPTHSKLGKSAPRALPPPKGEWLRQMLSLLGSYFVGTNLKASFSTNRSFCTIHCGALREPSGK